MSNILSLVCIFTVFLFPVVFSQSTVTAYVDQEKACEEYQKCLASRESKAGTVKAVRAASNPVAMPVDKHICAYKSNCRKERRALCRKQIEQDGSVEMKFACQVSWLSGSDETDATDPITATNIEPDQTIACSNYEKCLATPDEEMSVLKTLTPAGDLLQYAKQVVCLDRTNCIKVKETLCDKARKDGNHEVGQFAALLCAISWYADADEKNSIGSRSFGVASRSQQLFANVCHDAKNGACVIS